MATRMQIQYYRRMRDQAITELVRDNLSDVLSRVALELAPVAPALVEVGDECADCHGCDCADPAAIVGLAEDCGCGCHEVPARAVPELVEVAGGHAITVDGKVAEVVRYNDAWGDGR